MRTWTFPTQRLLTLCFLVFYRPLLAQQNPSVNFSGTQMRAAISLPQGTSTVQICGLEPDHSYSVVALPMAYGQRANFEIAPATVFSKGTSSFVFMRDRKNAVRFAAPNACVDIQVKTSSLETRADVPLYLSIRCESCPEANSWLKEISGLADQSLLQVESGYSAQELIEDVLVGGGCFQISNVSFSGQDEQIGVFSNGLSNIGFSDGIILATGNIDLAPGPNFLNGASMGYGINTPDADLNTLSSGDLNDMANIEFDFVPTQSQVSFEFVFASEEYCEFVNTSFNDVFGFFISGPGITGTQNLALIPATNTPVTINNVNHMVNSAFYTHNTPVFGNNCQNGGSGTPPPTPVPPATGPATQELQYDGFTKKMTAVANVIPCEKYHIKLKIADVGDGVWDSAVFLRANSFNAGGAVLASPAYPGGLGSAYENCSNGKVRFKRGNNDTSQPLEVNFTVGGTATPFLDYAPISSPVTIPAGQTEILIPINVIPDQIAENTETIQFIIPNACSCTQGLVEFEINDRLPLQVEASNQVLCLGDTATLSATVSGGLPYVSYLWSTGETTASIQASTASVYQLTVSDGCESVSDALELGFTVCDCNAETFIKTVGIEGQKVRGYGVYDSKDGNLYVTGLKQDSALIIKMTPAGAVLWMRTFDVQDGSNDNISELIVDSEGMLVGCGNSNDVQPGVTGFIFRYNPVTDNLQWVNGFGNESPYVMGLVELPNGNYLVYDNPHAGGNDNRMLEFTRSDGTIEFASPLTQKFNLGDADNFNSATIHNGKLYGVGRYTNGFGFNQMRHALSRINLGTGNVEWTRLSHVAPDLAARLYGMDLLIEEEHIISISFGDETGEDLNNSKIFLQKTGLAGNLVWVKRIDLTEITGEIADEIISVPDGFIIYAHVNSVPSDLYLIKTDKEGNVQWSKKIDYGFADFVGAVSTFQSQILLKDNHLFLIASTDGTAGSQMLVLKTTLDGTVEGNCDFIHPTPATGESVVSPANFAVSLQEVNFDEQTGFLIRSTQNAHLLVENQCKVFLNENVNLTLCPGESVLIDSVLYTQDTTFQVEILSADACDTLRTYHIQTLPYPTRAESIVLCPGNSVNIGGQVYNQSGVVTDTLPALVGCDTLVTYTITLLPYPTRAESIVLCPGNSVQIGGQVYDQAGVVLDTLPAQLGCDTVVTYTITIAPFQTRNVQLSFCPGESVSIAGQVYTQSGVVLDTLPALNGCDTIVTYTLTLLSQPTRAETIVFCPGESVTLGITVYTQPTVVVLSLPSNGIGCDTLVTYTLAFSTPAPSNVSITCPASINLDPPANGGGAVVNFNEPTVSSDCTCPGIELSQTGGLASGSLFPEGLSTVCFTAKDSCGQTASCCFNVSIGSEDPCDVKVNGCIKYELLTITEDMGKNRTYRIRVTNNCANKLIYTAIQIPDGLVAVEPANQSTYTAPSGNTYVVRSPNYSPQYSIRYSSVSDSIHNGESDIFKYTIPAQANEVLYINVVSRLAPYVYLSAHLNTFYCPIGSTPSNDRPDIDRENQAAEDAWANLEGPQELLLFPNPTSGELFVDLSPWSGAQLNIQVLDGRGQRVQSQTLTAGSDAQALELPSDLPGGIYVLEVLTRDGEKYLSRFVIQR